MMMNSITIRDKIYHLRDLSPAFDTYGVIIIDEEHIKNMTSFLDFMQKPHINYADYGGIRLSGLHLGWGLCNIYISNYGNWESRSVDLFALQRFLEWEQQEELDSGSYWFPLTEEGLNDRIKLLERYLTFLEKGVEIYESDEKI